MTTTPVIANETAKPKCCFTTTHWSVVVNAAGTDTTQACGAMGKLCQAYWYPIYSFIRRRGNSPEDAEDLTQEFFFRLLRHDWVAAADQSKGRFRSFLIMILDRFLANEWDRIRASKRGGGIRPISLSMDAAETRYACEPATTTTPEHLFERQWALTLLDHVLTCLREEYQEAGKGALFDALKPCLVGSGETQPYIKLAASLSMTEGAIKVAVHRLRDRYRQRLKEEIAHTVASAADVESELRHLFRSLARQ